MGRERQGDVILIQWDVYEVSQNSFLAESSSVILVPLDIPGVLPAASVELLWIYPRETDIRVWLTGVAHLTSPTGN